MPNGERFEAISGGVSQGPSFLEETGTLGTGTHFVLKPAVAAQVMKNTITITYERGAAEPCTVEYFLFQGKQVGCHKFDPDRTVRELFGQVLAIKPLAPTNVTVIIK